MSMTSKGKDIEILSFSLPKKIVNEIDELSKEVGYTTRSELIRDALRSLIRSKVDIDKINGKVEGVIVLLYQHSADNKVSELRHKHMDMIKSFMHTDFRERASKCCDVLIFSGEAPRLRKILYDFEAITNVESVQLFVA
jgi:CopG family nickel-responsive transcriptional regulator